MISARPTTAPPAFRGHNFRQRRKIGGHAIKLLGAAGTDTEARQDFVEDQLHPVPPP